MPQPPPPRSNGSGVAISRKPQGATNHRRFVAKKPTPPLGQQTVGDTLAPASAPNDNKKPDALQEVPVVPPADGWSSAVTAERPRTRSSSREHHARNRGGSAAGSAECNARQGASWNFDQEVTGIPVRLRHCCFLRLVVAARVFEVGVEVRQAMMMPL